MNCGVMYEFTIDKTSSQYKAPFSAMFNGARVFTCEDTAVVTPNSDTPYSMLWLDLRAEPIVISVPAVDPKRHYAAQLIDGNTCNDGYIGSRATGSEAGDFLVTGPGWTGQRPDGIRQVFQPGTDFSLVIFRTQRIDAADMPLLPRPRRSTFRRSARTWPRRISSNSSISRCNSPRRSRMSFSSANSCPHRGRPRQDLHRQGPAG
jgi:hypothetical protein